jgi:CheY-like chemotaxis protein
MAGPLKSLIVDDSPAARAQARAALDDAQDVLGLRLAVDEVGSGVEALRVLASTDVVLLIVDLHMPDMTGLEVLSFWRGRSRESGRRALVVSTDVSVRDREKALEGGAHAFLEKPMSSEALIEALRDFGGALT